MGVVVGADEDMIRVEVEGIGADRLFIPVAVVDVEDAVFVIIGVVHEGRVCRRRVRMARDPEQDLMVAGQDGTDAACRLDRIARRWAARGSLTTAVYGKIVSKSLK